MSNKITVAAAILTVGILAVPASAASFAINEPFSTPGALDSSWVVSGQGFTPSIVTNAGDTPENALRLTDATNNKSGFVLYDTPISTNRGVDITFKQAQWGGNGADGMVFFVKNAANTSNAIGARLAYSSDVASSTPGLPGALLAVALDSYGSFGTAAANGNGCNSTFTGSQGNGNENAVTLRGPGNNLDGYCLLADSYSLAGNGKLPLINNYASRAAATRTVRVVLDAANKTDAKVTVYYQDEQIIQAPLPDAFSDVSNIKIGFSAGTGGLNNNHEVWGLTSQDADPIVEEPVVEEPVDNGNTDEELAATGASSEMLWTGFAASLMLMAAGVFAVRRSRRS